MTEAKQNPERFLEVAIAAAREAGEIIAVAMDHPKDISYKGEVDIVTGTDRKSEAAILARLREEFPDHAIIAEEGGASGAGAAAEYEWHVDPLDGTTNFAHGYPVFAVSIGLLHRGEPLVGAVYNPVNGEMFSAIRGQGAQRNSKETRVSSVETLSRSLLATGFPAQAGTKSEHPLLLGVHVAFAWRAARRRGGAGFVFGGVWAIRRILGVWIEVVGHGCWNSVGARSGRQSDKFLWRTLSSG